MARNVDLGDATSRHLDEQLEGIAMRKELEKAAKWVAAFTSEPRPNTEPWRDLDRW